MGLEAGAQGGQREDPGEDDLQWPLLGRIPWLPRQALPREPPTCVATRFSYSASSWPMRKGVSEGSSSEVEGRLPAGSGTMVATVPSTIQSCHRPVGGWAAALRFCLRRRSPPSPPPRIKTPVATQAGTRTREGLVGDQVLGHVLGAQGHAVLADGQRVGLWWVGTGKGGCVCECMRTDEALDAADAGWLEKGWLMEGWRRLGRAGWCMAGRAAGGWARQGRSHLQHRHPYCPTR